ANARTAGSASAARVRDTEYPPRAEAVAAAAGAEKEHRSLFRGDFMMSQANPTPTQAPGPSGRPGLPPLPPASPPRVNPQLYKLGLVSYLLEKAAYFNMFAVDNPDEPDVPIPAPGDPNGMIGLYVHDVTHRFDVRVQQPTLERGLRAVNIVGEEAAQLSLR